MDKFKELAQKFGFFEESKTEKIMQERAKLKKTMEENLRKIGFTRAEIKEVLDILKNSEEEIQERKDMLIGTNINNDDVIGTMQEIFDDIRAIELQAASDIRAKIAEIKARKV